MNTEKDVIISCYELFMEAYTEFPLFCALIPNDRWRGLSDRWEDGEQQKGKSKSVVSNSCYS